MQFKESRALLVAGLQTAPVAQSPSATWDAFAVAVDSARTMFDGLGMVVAPELHLSAPGPLLTEPAEYAEEVAVDYRELPWIAQIKGALTPGATAVWDEVPDNVLVDTFLATRRRPSAPSPSPITSSR